MVIIVKQKVALFFLECYKLYPISLSIRPQNHLRFLNFNCLKFINFIYLLFLFIIFYLISEFEKFILNLKLWDFLWLSATELFLRPPYLHFHNQYFIPAISIVFSEQEAFSFLVIFNTSNCMVHLYRELSYFIFSI